MTAREARKLAIAANLKNDGGQYNEIVSNIIMASQSGELEIWYHKPIKKCVLHKLIEDGYKVGDEIFDKGEFSTKISYA